MTTSISPNAAGRGPPAAQEVTPPDAGTGNHADNMLDKVMADIEARRDKRDQKVVGAVGSGSIHVVGKALRENQREEAADRVLLKAVNKYAKSVTDNARKVKIA